MADAWVELIKMAQSLLAALIGGCLVLLGGWLSDRRKNRADDIARERRQRALLTGMFAVRTEPYERAAPEAPATDERPAA